MVDKPLTSKDLRKQCKRSKEKAPCYICGKHAEITELHHVVPLSRCAKKMNRLNLKEIEVETVWLCPNCHAYVHKYFDTNKATGTNDFSNAYTNGDISESELTAFIALRGKAFIQELMLGGTSYERASNY